MKSTNLFTTREAAKRLNYSIDNIYRLTLSGKLTPTKMLGRSFFTDEELTRYESTRKTRANAE